METEEEAEAMVAVEDAGEMVQEDISTITLKAGCVRAFVLVCLFFVQNGCT